MAAANCGNRTRASYAANELLIYCSTTSKAVRNRFLKSSVFVESSLMTTTCGPGICLWKVRWWKTPFCSSCLFNSFSQFSSARKKKDWSYSLKITIFSRARRKKSKREAKLINFHQYLSMAGWVGLDPLDRHKLQDCQRLGWMLAYCIVVVWATNVF